MLFAEKVVEIIKPVKHLHITFTIPKLLRAYFKRNRKHLKLLPQCANYAVNQYFHKSLGMDEGLCGGIYYVQTQGSFYNYHPHVHALVPSGIEHEGVFHEEKTVATQIIAELFRNRLLSVLVNEGIISEERREGLQWNHNSGFNVHSEGKIDGRNIKAIETVALYLSRSPISVDRVSFDSENNAVVVTQKPKGNKYLNETAVWSVLEFLALVMCHIPGSYESLVYYYGIYSSSHRGKEKREQTDNQEVEVEEKGGIQALTQGGKVNSTWARLIQKIFEVDPLKCTKCGGEMRIIAFIRSEPEITKILRHIQQETIRPPPLQATRTVVVEKIGCQNPYEYYYVPTADDYLSDPIYPD